MHRYLILFAIRREENVGMLASGGGGGDRDSGDDDAPPPRLGGDLEEKMPAHVDTANATLAESSTDPETDDDRADTAGTPPSHTKQRPSNLSASEKEDFFDADTCARPTFLGQSRRRSSATSLATSEAFSYCGGDVDFGQRRLSDEALSGFLHSCCSPADVVRLKEILDHVHDENPSLFAPDRDENQDHTPSGTLRMESLSSTTTTATERKSSVGAMPIQLELKTSFLSLRKDKHASSTSTPQEPDTMRTDQRPTSVDIAPLTNRGSRTSLRDILAALAPQRLGRFFHDDSLSKLKNETEFLTRVHVNARAFVFRMLPTTLNEDPLSRRVDWLVLFVVSLNVIASFLSTVEEIQVTPQWEYALKVIEIFSFVFFVVEYLLRVYCCVEDANYAHKITGRLRFMISFWSLVDLVAIVPYFYFITRNSVDGLGYTDDAAAATFSIIKLLRLIRLERHMETFTLYRRALSNSGNWLLANASVVIIVLALFSAVLYYLERNNENALPENSAFFSSIPSTMFLVMLMLCGEAPVIDLSPGGKLCAVILLIIGIMLLSTIISLFTNHFEIAARENMERHQRTKRRWETAMKMATLQTRRKSENKKRAPRSSRRARWSSVIKQIRTNTGRNLVLAGRRFSRSGSDQQKIRSRNGRETAFFKKLKRGVAAKEAAAVQKEADFVASLTSKQKKKYMKEKQSRAERDAKKSEFVKKTADQIEGGARQSKLRANLLKAPRKTS